MEHDVYLTNVSKYVATGAIFGDKAVYRNNCIGIILFSIFLGIYPGVILKSYWLFMTVILILIALFSTAGVLLISSKPFTVKSALIMDSIQYSALISIISIIELMYFSVYYGFHAAIIFAYVPVALIPLIIGIKRYNLLKTSEFDLKKSTKGNTKIIGFYAGMTGIHLGVIFKELDQGTWCIIIVICFTILNCFLSLGLLSMQKLYYMIKYNIPEPTK